MTFEQRVATDKVWLLDVLADGQAHTLNEILRRSFHDRGCGLTVHSRVADLRRDGHNVQHLRVLGVKRGDSHAYQLRAPIEKEEAA